MDDITAYHECGHAVIARHVGARVLQVTIVPEDDDGPQRFGDTQVEWRMPRHSREFQERAILVAMAGPVAEMIYGGDPFHPGLVAEWADDWNEAWSLAENFLPEERKRLAYLEQATRHLHEFLNQDHAWQAVATLADNVLAHETLDCEQVEEILACWPL